MPASLLALALAAPCAPQDLVHLRDVYGRGDPAALAVSADESVLFSAEGAVVRELALDAFPLGAASERAVILVDAATVALAAGPERLYVAGGSQGFLAVDLRSPERPVRLVEDRGDAVCTDVELHADRVLALFGARDDSTLVAYERETLERTAEVPLGPGTAWAIALDGEAAYVAMGPGGLVRVELAGDALAVRRGPRGVESFPPPEGLRLEPGVVHDVACAGGRLWAAADAGLAEIDLAAEWSEATPVRLRTMHMGGKPTYVRRVAARGDRLAVGTNAAPNEVLDGAPFQAYGRMSGSGVVGAVDPGAYVRGDEEHLLLFQLAGGELERIAHVQPGGGWRGLVLGAERHYEQHIRAGLVVRELAAEGMRVLSHTQPTGYPSAHGVFSVRRPERLLFGVDSAGARFDGFLALARGGSSRTMRLERLPLEGTTWLGCLPGAPWPARDADSEWLVDGDGFDLRLHRLTHGEGVRIDTWTLCLPEDPDGRRGHTYFHSARAGDLLLVSRHASRNGLLVFSAAALEEEAARTPPGSALRTPPLFQVATHPSDAARSPTGSWKAMKLALAELPDGRRIAALAAGHDSSDGHALLLLYGISAEARADVGAGTPEAPRLLGAARGDRPGGHAIAVALARSGERTWAIVADGGFGVRTFDVTDPRNPRAGGAWEAPRNVFDGHPDVPLDVAVRAGRAYVACARLGLVCLDVSDPDAGPLRVVAVRDTPGLAYGVALGEVDGEPVLAVGDHQAGVRVYGGEGPR